MCSILRGTGYTVSRGDVWLLQERGRFDILAIGKRKPIKMLKEVCFY
jgi:hypothetical protein